MKYFFLFLAGAVLLSSSPASASIIPCATTENSAACTLCHLIVGFWNLIDYGFKILVFVALTGLVIAGIMYILSAGSEQMITTAKSFIKSIYHLFDKQPISAIIYP